MKRAVLAVCCLALATSLLAAPVAAAEPTSPNVVFIMLDDVPVGFVDGMSYVHRKLAKKGMTFENGVVPTSLCCPSRASTLTGDYAHTTGTYTNHWTAERPYGAWQSFRDNGNEKSTLATHLNAAGYRTALVGKYLNGFGANQPKPARRKTAVPAGWDDFVTFSSPAYYNYDLIGTVSETHGASPEDYSTDVLAQHAVDFISSTPEQKPLFLFFAPYAAHSPWVPAARHKDTWTGPLELPGSFNEKNMSDKSSFMKTLPKVRKSKMLRVVRRQHEMLMSADEGVRQIVDALGPDRTANTLFVLMSDNGLLTGAHRLTGKDFPYAGSTNVPMLMRWDGQIAPKSVSERLTLNIDLTATIAEATGTSWAMDGKSALTQGRRSTVLEQSISARTEGPDDTGKFHPPYCGFRSNRWLFIEWSNDRGQELYDYATDPNERHNLAGRKGYANRLKKLRHKTRIKCSPTPPEFTWNATPG